MVARRSRTDGLRVPSRDGKGREALLDRRDSRTQAQSVRSTPDTALASSHSVSML